MIGYPITIFVSIDQQSGATCTKAAGERGRGFVRCSSITQLAVKSVSPARHSTVVEDGAGVGTSGRERYCSATCTEAAGERGCGFVRCSSITQSAVTSVSPARHSTVVEDGAGVEAPEESATAVRPVPRLLVSVGVVLVDVPPLPNWPSDLRLPSTTQHRCRGWRRCGSLRKRALLLWRPVPKAAGERRAWFCQMFLHYPIGRDLRIPSTTQHRCRGWRRCGKAPEESATAVRPVPRLLVSVGVVLVRCSSITQSAVTSVSPARHRHRCRGSAQVWGTSGRERYGSATCTEAAGERGWWFCQMFLHYPIGRNLRLPSTTQHRCRGWRRCGSLDPEESATAVRPVPRLLVSVGGGYGQMFLHYPIGRNLRLPSTTQHRCRGWRRCGRLRKRA